MLTALLVPWTSTCALPEIAGLAFVTDDINFSDSTSNGDMTLYPASDESEIDDYVVYWGSEYGTCEILGGYGNYWALIGAGPSSVYWNAAAQRYEKTITDVSIQSGAKTIVIYSYNQAARQISSTCRHMTFSPPPPPSEGEGASIELAWDIPTTRQDGALLNTSEITGYTVYYGFAPNQYNDSIFIAGGNQKSVVFPYGEPGDTLYAVITAWDEGGLESGYSNALEVMVQ
jgi:hypothetical protein